MKFFLPLALIFSMFVSCTKFSLSDYRKNPGLDMRFCNIKTWTDLRGDELRTNVFEYDSSGYPVSITSNLNGTGNGSHFFSYNQDHRLIKYEYEFAFIKEYHYEGLRRNPEGAKVTDASGREFAETYTYDDKGRIIKSVQHFISSPFEYENGDQFPDEVKEYVYLYDDLSSMLLNGNQVNPDVVYTNKPSIYMTNKVWMFVNQNYSKHAIDGVASVSPMGLPLSFKADHYEFPFLDISGENSTVTYECW